MGQHTRHRIQLRPGGDVPLVADWTNTGVQRIGVFRSGQWWLDVNGDHQWTASPPDALYGFGQAGEAPVFIGTIPGTLPSLQTCLSSPSQTYCDLSPGTHSVTSTININRYGVTLSGANTPADHTQTRLIRDPSFHGTLIQVAVPGVNQPTVTLAQTGLTGIVIKDLTICGAGNSHANVVPGLQPAIMSPTGAVSTSNPCADHTTHPSAAGCDYGSSQCVDLAVANIDSGYYPSNPFANSSPYALELNDVDMEDAAGHALSLYSAGPDNYASTPAQKVNDVWIHNSVINYSAITGILYGFNFQLYDDRFCDTYA